MKDSIPRSYCQWSAAVDGVGHDDANAANCHHCSVVAHDDYAVASDQADFQSNAGRVICRVNTTTLHLDDESDKPECFRLDLYRLRCRSTLSDDCPQRCSLRSVPFDLTSYRERRRYTFHRRHRLALALCSVIDLMRHYCLTLNPTSKPFDVRMVRRARSVPL